MKNTDVARWDFGYWGFILLLGFGGCRANAPWGAQTIPAPLGHDTRPAAYYSPPTAGFGSAGNSSAPTVNRPQAPISLAPNGVSTASPRTFGLRDTDQVSLRTPQDQQPIRISERSSANPTFSSALNTQGMTVNDGTSARSWGQVAQASASPKFGTMPQPTAGISIAGLRGTGNSPGKNAISPTFSAGDSAWRARTANESEIRR